MKKRFNGRAFLGKALGVIFVAALLVFTLYPVLYAILGSFKTNMELVLGETFLPSQWHFENYVYAFDKLNFFQYTLNSVILCGICTVLSIFISSMAGYCMARHEFPFKKLLNTLYLALMFISLGSVSIYPVYVLMNDLKMTNNLFGLALVITGGQAANIFLVRGFINTVPRELDESAFLDGCTPFGIYWRLIIPLIRPMIAVVGLFAFRNAWNDYITSMVFTIGRKAIQPLTVAVIALRYSANAAAEWHIMAAGASIALLPVLIVYAFTNKQFISGLTAGAVKG
ncbi:MAG TPA: carbohydrate ABC transporter permease [Candidatus Limiplasma sp.]|nr:carbohydrate ABC transporter permease [Candidatus Limiplasma sp.]HPS80399.1 carbohydrate ABC transporter permease [Candidatus Limiplasma sp.]